MTEEQIKALAAYIAEPRLQALKEVVAKDLEVVQSVRDVEGVDRAQLKEALKHLESLQGTVNLDSTREWIHGVAEDFCKTQPEEIQQALLSQFTLREVLEEADQTIYDSIEALVASTLKVDVAQ